MIRVLNQSQIVRNYHERSTFTWKSLSILLAWLKRPFRFRYRCVVTSSLTWEGMSTCSFLGRLSTSSLNVSFTPLFDWWCLFLVLFRKAFLCIHSTFFVIYESGIRLWVLCLVDKRAHPKELSSHGIYASTRLRLREVGKVLCGIFMPKKRKIKVRHRYVLSQASFKIYDCCLEIFPYNPLLL